MNRVALNRIIGIIYLSIFLLIELTAQHTTYFISYDVGQHANNSTGMILGDNGMLYIRDFYRCYNELRQGSCQSILPFRNRPDERNAQPILSDKYTATTMIGYEDGHLLLGINNYSEPPIEQYMVLELDSNLNRIDSIKVVFDYHDAAIYRMIKMNDSIFYISGDVRWPSGIDYKNAVYLAKFQRGVGMIWEHVYDSVPRNVWVSRDLDIYQDSLVLVSGNDPYYNIQEPSGFTSTAPRLYCINGSGDVVWRWSPDHLRWTLDGWRENLSTLPLDEGFIYAFHDTDRMPFLEFFLERIHADFSVGWRYVFPIEGLVNVTKLIEARNGDIVGSGFVDANCIPAGADPHGNTLAPCGLLFRLTPNGDIKWLRTYWHTGDSSEFTPSSYTLNNLIELDNGDLISRGSHFDTIGLGFVNTNSFVLRVNSEGLCPSDECDILITTVEEMSSTTEMEPLFDRPDIRIAPNPTDDILRIVGEMQDIAHLYIYDQTGRLVDRHDLSSSIGATEYTWSVGTMPAGVYTVLCMDAQGWTLARDQVVISR